MIYFITHFCHHFSSFFPSSSSFDHSLSQVAAEKWCRSSLEAHRTNHNIWNALPSLVAPEARKAFESFHYFTLKLILLINLINNI